MSAREGDTPFGSKVKRGMFRTVSQLYKVCCFVDVHTPGHASLLLLPWCVILSTSSHPVNVLV